MTGQSDIPQSAQNLPHILRHIDGAIAYGNEAGVGEAVRESGLKREDIFISEYYLGIAYDSVASCLK